MPRIPQCEGERLALLIMEVAPVPSKSAIKIDDTVVLGIFGKAKSLAIENNPHIPLTLSREIAASPNLLLAVYEAFERDKESYAVPSAKQLMAATQATALSLKRSVREVKAFSNAEHQLLHR
jgi:hypothetical protein